MRRPLLSVMSIGVWLVGAPVLAALVDLLEYEDRASSAPPAQAGSDVVTINAGTDLTCTEGPPGFLVNRVVFFGPGHKALAQVRPGDPSSAALLGKGWSPVPRGRVKKGLAVGLRGSAGEIRCAIPKEAAAVELTLICPPNLRGSLALTVNDSRASFAALHGLHQSLFRLTSRTGKAALSDQPPIYNLWHCRDSAETSDFDAAQMEIDTTPGNDPLSTGEYRLHVHYTTREGQERRPRTPIFAVLGGLDITQYDGFVIGAKTPERALVSATLKTNDNFAWGGRRFFSQNGQWADFALPFETLTNPTTAGDGVLKLSTAQAVRFNVDFREGKGGREGDVWLRPPRFYRGAPPDGVPVAGDARRAERECELTSLSPERRKAMHFSGTSVQSIARDGETIWLGTDRGVTKVGRGQPGVALATWTTSEGLVDDDVQAVCPDGKDVWIGTTNGLSRFEGSTFQNFTSENGLLPGPVMAIGATPNSVWLGMTRGLARFDKPTGKIQSFKRRGGWAPESTGGQGVPVKEGRAVYADSLFIDKDGTVWHGAAGFDHTAADGRPIQHYHGTVIRTIGLYPSEGNLWFVSSKGVEYVDPKKDEPLFAQPLALRVGLPAKRRETFITASCPDSDRFWLAFNDGLGWFDVKQRAMYWSPNFSVSMGALVPQCLMADDKSLWVGTDNGLMVLPKARAGSAWPVLDYDAPVDLMAAGVDVDEEEDCSPSGGHVITVDSEQGAEGSAASLRMDFTLGSAPDSAATLRQEMRLDLKGYGGLSFFSRADKQRQVSVDVRRISGQGRRWRQETWRSLITVGPQWQRFVLPFDKMQLVSGKQIREDTAYISGVDLLCRADNLTRPGDKGQLWVDKLQWYR